MKRRSKERSTTPDSFFFNEELTVVEVCRVKNTVTIYCDGNGLVDGPLKVVLHNVDTKPEMAALVERVGLGAHVTYQLIVT